MLFKIRYGTFSNYSPRGQSDLSKKSRGICGGIKAGRKELIDYVARFIVAQSNCVLAEFVTPDTTFVPVPGSAPVAPGGLWTPRLICERLLSAGLGREMLLCLRRTSPVPKSAFATAGGRPTIQAHHASMCVTQTLLPPNRITLVDDVLTRGRTSFASAQRLHEAFPNAEIRVFAIIRTQGLVPEIARIVDPAVGYIVLTNNGMDVDRQP